MENHSNSVYYTNDSAVVTRTTQDLSFKPFNAPNNFFIFFAMVFMYGVFRYVQMYCSLFT